MISLMLSILFPLLASAPCGAWPSPVRSPPRGCGPASDSLRHIHCLDLGPSRGNQRLGRALTGQRQAPPIGPEQLLGEPKSAELTGGQHDGLTVPAELNFLTLELDDVHCAHVDTGLGRGEAPAPADDGRPRVLLAFVVIVIDVPGARPVRPGELQSRVLDAPECLRSVILGQD